MNNIEQIPSSSESERPFYLAELVRQGTMLAEVMRPAAMEEGVDN